MYTALVLAIRPCRRPHVPTVKGIAVLHELLYNLVTFRVWELTVGILLLNVCYFVSSLITALWCRPLRSVARRVQAGFEGFTDP